MRILVLRGGAVGDFIVTLPALKLLRDRWPGAHIELIGNPRAAELGVIAGVLDVAHSQHEARWAALYGEGALPRELAEWLEKFQIVVSFWPDPEREFARHFGKNGQVFLSGGAHPETRPAAAHFGHPLKALGLRGDTFAFRLELPAGLAEAVLARWALKTFIAIHPGSGAARKNWPAERWREVAAKLAVRFPVLWITGPADDAEPPAGVAAVFWAKDWALPVLGSALAPSRCALFLGHDSGLSHLAGAVGARCCLLFGPTDPAVWAPPGDHVRVLRRGDDLRAIAADDVVAAALDGLADGAPASAAGS